MRPDPRALLGVMWLTLAGCGAADPSSTCTDTTTAALQTCVADYGDRLVACYAATGAACADDDATLLAALDALDAEVSASCTEGSFGALDAAAVPARLQTSCSAEASSIAWRTFGGPQGAAWSTASTSEQTCLTAAHDAALSLVDASLAAIDLCEVDGCDAATLDAERATLQADAQRAVDASCGNLPGLIALDPATYVSNTALQVDCLAAAARSDTGALALDCGPSNAELDVPRGTWTEVVVDSERWGTQCGDGSEYAFWIRPAPEGARLDKVVVALQGGGVCLFGEDCAPRRTGAPQLFSARDPDDRPSAIGIASDDPSISPFHDWTMVYLPYCNQDVFAGGGVVEDLGDLQLPRYGAVNLRASVRMVRDYLWGELDAAGGEGFRPDELVALFGGFSAGGYGTLYNYHWFLDDLQWPRTTAFPDGGLALDNGELLGVGSLGTVKIPAWGMLERLPPYCFEGPCSGGETLLRALSPRLRRAPQQNMLLLSNQLDSTQRGDAFFSDDASFINGLRQMYCDTRDLNGVHWYLTSESTESLHVVSLREELWTGEVDGVRMSEYFLGAVESPALLTSHVEEGNFVDDVPGVEPFPCALP